MKICLTNKYKSFDDSITGKGKFANRLISQLRKMEHYVTSDPNEIVDIHMEFSQFYFEGNGEKRVVRIGPINYTKDEDAQYSNKRKSKAIKDADGVIYQSNFSKNSSDIILRPCDKPFQIIPNGSKELGALNSEPKKTKFNFLACARGWTQQKRLKQIIKAYKQANVPNSILQVAGETDLYEKKIFLPEDKTIYFLGNLCGDDLDLVYSNSDLLIHAVYIDACPNVVVESLCSGLRVLCTDQGGTKELLSGVEGCCVIEDDPFEIKLYDKLKIPDLDVDDLSLEMELISHEFKYVETPERLKIENVAAEYVRFFERVLN